MIMATSPKPHLCSTSVIEDARSQDDVIGIRLSYTYYECFFNVLISTDFCYEFQPNQANCVNASAIKDFISRFNSACTVTEEDRLIADVDERLDDLWHEAEEWIRAVGFEKIMWLGRKYGHPPLRGVGDWSKTCSLIDYLYPKCFNLQLVAAERGFCTINRADLDPYLPFATEPGLPPPSDVLIFNAQGIEILHRPRAHVLKVRTSLGIFCCKLNNAGAQNSLLREFDTLREIGKRIPAHVKIPRLRGVVQVQNGIIGIMTDWVDTEDSDMMALLGRKKDILMSTRQKWADCISETVHLLHANNLIWGDAKTSNILIDRDWEAWLIDFGGGYTQGWIDEGLYDTRKGDLQGVSNTLLDIFGKR